jgi:hypothetical protein
MNTFVPSRDWRWQKEGHNSASSSLYILTPAASYDWIIISVLTINFMALGSKFNQKVLFWEGIYGLINTVVWVMLVSGETSGLNVMNHGCKIHIVVF